MKYLGQHIFDFNLRARSDVFLESIASGTIASGGHLGLDSNNKIVKATISSTTDLASDVTGVLPVANGGTGSSSAGGAITNLGLNNANNITTGTLDVDVGGTGATSLTDNAVLLGNGTSAIEASAHLTYSNFAPGGGVNIDQLTVGDASSTGAKVLTPGTIPMTVGPDASSGSNVAGANLNLQGGQSTGNTAGGSIRFLSSVTGSSGSVPNSTAEIAAFDNVGNLQIDGSLTIGSTEVINSSAQVSASAIPTLNQNTTGTATNATKQIVVTTHNFQLANTTGTFFYVPFNNLNESSAGTMANYWTRTVPPYDGTVKKIAVRSHTSLGTSCELRVSKITDTTDALTSGTHVDNTSIDLSTAHTTVVETMNSNSFSAGDAVGVAIKRSAGVAAQVVLTIAWEYTT
tara:strand:- start:172 stop:1380 length:1209 start_codon:yes stop_codon:yes gene_type:complete